ncbi:hypothetical protein [Streptomyces aureus]|uniref:hypothetical protein n=1 Tax=Streptomyces aureus TaxID=193461 RepID=UPI0036320EC9
MPQNKIISPQDPHLKHALEAPVDGHGLAGPFPPDLTGYYDGAKVSVPVALELVRAMLRDQGAWCRLEQQDTFTVHVGWDQYVYVGSDQPCEAAVVRTRELGLFAEPITASPYAADREEPEVTQAADEDFGNEYAQNCPHRRRSSWRRPTSATRPAGTASPRTTSTLFAPRSAHARS